MPESPVSYDVNPADVEFVEGPEPGSGAARINKHYLGSPGQPTQRVNEDVVAVQRGPAMDVDRARLLLERSVAAMAAATQKDKAGTTFSAAVVADDGKRIVTAHLGDSPVYAIVYDPKTGKAEAKRLTKDHDMSDPQEVARLRAELEAKGWKPVTKGGDIYTSPDGKIAYHIQKHRHGRLMAGGVQTTRGLGEADIDFQSRTPEVQVHDFSAEVDAGKKVFILGGSDGLSKGNPPLTPQQFADMVAEQERLRAAGQPARSPAELAGDIVRAVAKQGAYDDLSAALIEAKPGAALAVADGHSKPESPVHVAQEHPAYKAVAMFDEHVKNPQQVGIEIKPRVIPRGGQQPPPEAPAPKPVARQFTLEERAILQHATDLEVLKQAGEQPGSVDPKRLATSQTRQSLRRAGQAGTVMYHRESDSLVVYGQKAEFEAVKASLATQGVNASVDQLPGTEVYRLTIPGAGTAAKKYLPEGMTPDRLPAYSQDAHVAAYNAAAWEAAKAVMPGEIAARQKADATVRAQAERLRASLKQPGPAPVQPPPVAPEALAPGPQMVKTREALIQRGGEVLEDLITQIELRRGKAVADVFRQSMGDSKDFFRMITDERSNGRVANAIEEFHKLAGDIKAGKPDALLLVDAWSRLPKGGLSAYVTVSAQDFDHAAVAQGDERALAKEYWKKNPRVATADIPDPYADETPPLRPLKEVLPKPPGLAPVQPPPAAPDAPVPKPGMMGTKEALVRRGGEVLEELATQIGKRYGQEAETKFRGSMGGSPEEFFRQKTSELLGTNQKGQVAALIENYHNLSRDLQLGADDDFVRLALGKTKPAEYMHPLVADIKFHEEVVQAHLATTGQEQRAKAYWQKKPRIATADIDPYAEEVPVPRPLREVLAKAAVPAPPSPPVSPAIRTVTQELQRLHQEGQVFTERDAQGQKSLRAGGTVAEMEGLQKRLQQAGIRAEISYDPLDDAATLRLGSGDTAKLLPQGVNLDTLPTSPEAAQKQALQRKLAGAYEQGELFQRQTDTRETLVRIKVSPAQQPALIKLLQSQGIMAEPAFSASERIDVVQIKQTDFANLKPLLPAGVTPQLLPEGYAGAQAKAQQRRVGRGLDFKPGFKPTPEMLAALPPEILNDPEMIAKDLYLQRASPDDIEEAKEVQRKAALKAEWRKIDRAKGTDKLALADRFFDTETGAVRDVTVSLGRDSAMLRRQLRDAGIAPDEMAATIDPEKSTVTFRLKDEAVARLFEQAGQKEMAEAIRQPGGKQPAAAADPTKPLALDPVAAAQEPARQLYDQFATKTLRPAEAAEVLLKGFGMDQAGAYKQALETGAITVKIDPADPQQLTDLLSANKALGNPMEVTRRGDTVELRLRTPEGMDPIVARAAQMQQLMEVAPGFKPNEVAAGAVAQVLQTQVEYRGKAIFFDRIADLAEKGKLGAGAKIPPDQQAKMPQQHEYLEAAKQYQAAKKSGDEAAAGQAKKKMDGIRADLEKTGTPEATLRAYNEQIYKQMRMTKASQVMNVVSAFQGISAIKQIQQDSSIPEDEKEIRIAIAYTQVASSGAGLVLDTAQLYRPVSGKLGTAGAGFGAVAGGFGMVTSGRDFLQARDAGDRTGMALSGGSFVSSSLGAVGGLAALGGYSTVGTVLMSGSAVVAAPVAVASLYVQGQAAADKTIGYLEERDQMIGRESDLARALSRPGQWAPDAHIPGLEPKLSDYKQLSNLKRLVELAGLKYDEGHPVDLAAIAGNPKELRRVITNIRDIHTKIGDEKYALGMTKEEVGLQITDSPLGGVGSWIVDKTGIRDEKTGGDVEGYFRKEMDKRQQSLLIGRAASAALLELDDYEKRQAEYIRRLKPIESVEEYKPRLAKLRDLEEVQRAVSAPHLTIGIAEKVMGKDTPEYNAFLAEYGKAGERDGKRFAEAQEIAQSKDIGRVKSFLGVSDEQWNRKDKNGKSLGQVVQERMDKNELLPMLNAHVLATSETKQVAARAFAKHHFEKEVQEVEALLAKDKERQTKLAATAEALQEVHKAYASGADPQQAETKLLAKLEEYQQSLGVDQSERDQQREKLRAALEQDRKAIAQGQEPKATARFLKEITPEEGEADRYFRLNRNFLERMELDKDPRVASVGLSTSYAQYLQKKMELTPALVEDQAKEELKQFTAQREMLDKQNEALKPQTAGLDEAVKMLTGQPLGDAPVSDAKGQPIRDGKGKVVTLADVSNTYAEAIEREQKALAQLKEKAEKSGDKDDQARVAIKETVIAKLELDKAATDQQNMQYKIKRAKEVKDAYRAQTAKLLATGAPLQADQDALREVTATATAKSAAFKKLLEQGKKDGDPDLLKAEVELLVAHRELAVKTLEVAGPRVTKTLEETSERDWTALRELMEKQDKLGIKAEVVPRDPELQQAIATVNTALGQLAKSPDDPDLKRRVLAAKTVMHEKQREHLELQFDQVVAASETYAEQTRDTIRHVMEMERLRLEAGAEAVSESQQTKDAREKLEEARAAFIEKAEPGPDAPIEKRIEYESERLDLLLKERAYAVSRLTELQEAQGQFNFPPITQPLDQSVTIDTRVKLGDGIGMQQVDGSVVYTAQDITRFSQGLQEKKRNLALMQMAMPTETPLPMLTKEQQQSLQEAATRLTAATEAFNATPSAQTQQALMDATVQFVSTDSAIIQAREKLYHETLKKEKAPVLIQKLAQWKKDFGDAKNPQQAAERLKAMLQDEEARLEGSSLLSLAKVSDAAKWLDGQPGVKEAYSQFLELVGGPQVLAAALKQADMPVPDTLLAEVRKVERVGPEPITAKSLDRDKDGQITTKDFDVNKDGKLDEGEKKTVQEAFAALKDSLSPMDTLAIKQIQAVAAANNITLDVSGKTGAGLHVALPQTPDTGKGRA